MSKKSTSPMPKKSTSITPALLLVFVFGVLFVLFLLVIMLFVPNPTAYKYTVFRIILALAAGGVAALIPGFLDIKMSQGAKFTLRAGGALAVFVIVYFYSPAAAVVNSPEPAAAVVIQGDCNLSTGDVAGSAININCI